MFTSLFLPFRLTVWRCELRQQAEWCTPQLPENHGSGGWLAPVLLTCHQVQVSHGVHYLQLLRLKCYSCKFCELCTLDPQNSRFLANTQTCMFQEERKFCSTAGKFCIHKRGVDETQNLYASFCNITGAQPNIENCSGVWFAL